MFYQAKLSKTERIQLGKLIGQPLETLVADGWSAELKVPKQVLEIVPKEIHTPDNEHQYGTVDRPQIKAKKHTSLTDHLELEVEQLGLIREINVLSVLVSFSRPTLGPAITLPSGATIPEGMNYGWIFYKPSEKQATINNIDDETTLVDLDIAIEFITEKIQSIVVYTRGYFIQVSLEGPPRNEDWVEVQAFTRQAVI